MNRSTSGLCSISRPASRNHENNIRQGLDMLSIPSHAIGWRHVESHKRSIGSILIGHSRLGESSKSHCGTD